MQNTGSNNVKLNNFIVVATFFSLWLAVYFEDDVENVFAYILILSFGILHGANDLKIMQKSERSNAIGKKYITALVYYILFVTSSLVLFHFIPGLTLLLFIIFSGYHFGEQHWGAKVRKRSRLTFGFFVFYGLFILFLLFSAHEIEVTGIIENITGYVIPQKFYFFTSICSGVIASLLYIICVFKKAIKSNILLQVFFLFVFYIIFNTAALLWAFAIYFILWHSLPSLADQIVFLYGNPSVKNIKKYIISSFPFWLISVMGLGFLLFHFRDDMKTSLSFFFSVLAAITFPHILVINRLNAR